MATRLIADEQSNGGASCHASPSLFEAGGEGPAAFEMKFLLSEEQARMIERRFANRLCLDPHANASLGNAYRTTSLYTDTPDLGIYHRTAELGGCKYRVRKYGANGPIFLERKKKSGDRVRKLRSTVPHDALNTLASNELQLPWAGDWFLQSIREHTLSPVCRIAYERVAYTGYAEESPVRVTFDRKIRGERCDGWNVAPINGDAPQLLEGQVICEFKFRVALPALFKDAIHELTLTPAAVSKYRLFMDTLALPTGKDMQ